MSGNNLKNVKQMSFILTSFHAHNNVLANLCHSEYPKCPVARMQAWRRLHQCIRCDGIFKNQFVTQSLLSPIVKEF